MPLITGTGAQPRIILGLMTFGPDPSKGARVTSLDDYRSCLRTFQSAGYNEIDTARNYIGGAQEAWSAQAGVFDMGFTVATKCYPNNGQTHKPADLRRSLEMSLKELDTKCVDIFYLHAADRSVPFEETLGELDKMHKEGKFVQLGLSNFTAFEVAEVVMICRQHGWVRPTVWQGMYNPITRSIEVELIPACRRYGLDLVVYNPIAGGLLSGRYSAEDLKTPPDEGRFSNTAGSGPMYRNRYFRDSTFESLKVIEDAVHQNGLTMIETAFRWMMHHSKLKWAKDGGNDGMLIGVSSEEQLKSNLANIDKGPLPDQVVKALDEAWMIVKPEAANYWHLDLKYTHSAESGECIIVTLQFRDLNETSADVSKITQLFDDFLKDGRLMRGEWGKSACIGFIFAIRMSTAYLADAIKKGVENFDTIVQRVLFINLMAARGQRCGDLGIARGWEQKHSLKWKHIELIRLDDVGEYCYLLARVPIEFVKGHKYAVDAFKFPH